MRAKLTADKVAGYKPKAKPYEVHDSDLRGLLLRVQPSGVKSYIVTWGRGKRSTLGRHPVMTVTGARNAALGALRESADHGAPLAVIEANKPETDRPITLGDFIGEHFAPWAKANQKAGQATVDALVACFGEMYERELRSVVAFDIERFKTRRRKAGIKPATINRDLDRIRKVYSCAVEWGFAI
jgi:Arm DNA-binding domain